jgi:hypothetical protein
MSRTNLIVLDVVGVTPRLLEQLPRLSGLRAGDRVSGGYVFRAVELADRPHAL